MRVSSVLARRGRWLSTLLVAAMLGALWIPGLVATARQATPVAIDHAEAAAEIARIVESAMTDYALNAAIVRVTMDGEEVITAAYGESMTGVPATADMHFRNGAVAISYMSTLLLQLVDRGEVSLDDPIATWFPDLPNADTITLRMLANMTSGFPDYVQNPDFIAQVYENPFRIWTTEEKLAFGLATPNLFSPGTNWAYAHTNYVILGQILEKVTGQPLDVALQENVLDPLGLENTTAAMTAEIPQPALHAYSAERREPLGIAPGVPFLEDSTFWNPSWTLAEGSIETTNIYDMTATAEAIGEGTLLSPESHAAQISPDLLGFGKPQEGCPTCGTMTEQYNYGLGVVLRGDWILQNPLFFGYSATEAYLPGEKIAVAVALTFTEDAFDDQGNFVHSHASNLLFNDIANYLAPGSVPAQGD